MVTVTSTSPEFVGALTVRDVEELMDTEVPETVPNFTVSPGLKFVPVTVTVVLAAPALGLMDVTVGAEYENRSAEEVAEVPALVTATVTFTVPDPAGTVTTIEPVVGVPEIVAGVEPNKTVSFAAVVENPDPLMVMELPLAPAFAESDETTGRAL